MSDTTRKRQREDGQCSTVEEKAKVGVIPLYSECGSGGGALCIGSTLTIPCSLGRRNLAELWWKCCPKGCRADRPQARPCKRFCSSVRRRSHRTLLSRELITIDASGRVDLRAKNSEIIRWYHEHCGTYVRSVERLISGESYILLIGDFFEEPEKPWMRFRISLCPVVTPERPRDVQENESEVSLTRRRLFHSTLDNTFNHNVLIDSGKTEKRHRENLTNFHDSLIPSRAGRVSMGLQQSSSTSLNQSDSSTGDKLDTQEDLPSGNARRNLISPESRNKRKDRLEMYHENYSDPPLQPCQLTFLDPPYIDSKDVSTRDESSSLVGKTTRGRNQSQESTLYLPRGETQNTYDDRMTSDSQSPPMKGSHTQAQDAVEIAWTSKCRDWSLDEWMKLAQQNLVSKFAKKVANLIVTKNRGTDGPDLQLPALFDDSTIGVSFGAFEKKTCFSKKYF